MVLSLSYRRPARVNSSRSSNSSVDTEKSDKVESISSGSSCPYGIPDALSFEKIISGGTCPPVTTREFMDFLQYIEHDAENLQFYLWYREYLKRWATLSESDARLAPEWTPEQARAEVLAEKEKAAAKRNAYNNQNNNNPATAILKGTDFDATIKTKNLEASPPNPFSTPPRTPIGNESNAPSTVGWSEENSTIGANINHAKKAAQAFEGVNALQPFTIQPFREEVSRIIAIYIADGGSRRLNLSAKEKAVLLKALSVTTHPSAFREVIATVEWSLRHQAHPNFIRWTICNGNPPRQTFAQGLGIGGIMAGLIYQIIITLSTANRGWRALGFLGYLIGVATLFAGWKGMCVVLHGMHHRHLRPWELFSDSDEASTDYDMKKDSFDSLGSSNSYEDEPWIAKYEKRNIIRKIFDREVWIQEPALRQIQDTIFLQAILSGVLVGAVMTAIFLAVPKGNFF